MFAQQKEFPLGKGKLTCTSTEPSHSVRVPLPKEVEPKNMEHKLGELGTANLKVAFFAKM
jgi:hypothetical protein